MVDIHVLWWVAMFATGLGALGVVAAPRWYEKLFSGFFLFAGAHAAVGITVAEVKPGLHEVMNAGTETLLYAAFPPLVCAVIMMVVAWTFVKKAANNR